MGTLIAYSTIWPAEVGRQGLNDFLLTAERYFSIRE